MSKPAKQVKKSLPSRPSRAKATPAKPLTAEERALTEWNARFSGLCYKIFDQTTDGQEFLQMVEHRHFYAPVANPHESMQVATFKEGQNDFIRRMRKGVVDTKMGVFKTSAPKTVTRKKK